MTALFRNTATTLATIAAFTTVAILGLALWAGLVPKDLLFTTSNGTSLSVNGKVDLIPPAEPIPVEIDDDGAGDLGQDTASDPLYGHGGGFGIAPVPQP